MIGWGQPIAVQIFSPGKGSSLPVFRCMAVSPLALSSLGWVDSSHYTHYTPAKYPLAHSAKRWGEKSEEDKKTRGWKKRQSSEWSTGCMCQQSSNLQRFKWWLSPTRLTAAFRNFKDLKLHIRDFPLFLRIIGNIWVQVLHPTWGGFKFCPPAYTKTISRSRR